MDFGVTKIQENTLIRIQSLFRGLKERENFKLLRDQHIEELAIREKLEAMKDEPGFSLQEEKKKLKKKLRLKNDDYDEYEEKEKKRKARLFEALDIQYENLFGKKPYGYVEKKKTTMYSSRKPAETMILDQQTSFRDNQRSPTATIKKPGVEETIVSK